MKDYQNIFSVLITLFLSTSYSKSPTKEVKPKEAAVAVTSSFDLPKGFEASEVQKKEIQDWFTKYVDILVREGGKWKFQTMAQAGWGDLLKTRKKPTQ
tara:strand:+ start:34542 stop:34835 length:294 start_codon:yes stop_codon:yes gene_type:complete